MEYEIENGVISEVSKKLVIIATNPLVCYLIVKVSYTNLLLITKLIVLDIESKVFGEANFANNSTAKSTIKIRPNEYVPRRLKN